MRWHCIAPAIESPAKARLEREENRPPMQLRSVRPMEIVHPATQFSARLICATKSL